MPTLVDTMRTWADGYNTLLAVPRRHTEPFGPALTASVAVLRRHASLADLAGAYWAGDQIRRIAQEHHPDTSYAESIRDASYWLRFMEIRHRRSRAS